MVLTGENWLNKKTTSIIKIRFLRKLEQKNVKKNLIIKGIRNFQGYTSKLVFYAFSATKTR